MFSDSPSDVLEQQKVHESNQPHGENAQRQHLKFQEACIQIWAAVLATFILVLLLVQSRRPRSTANFVRWFDMRPITAAPPGVSTEFGGVIFLFYFVTCGCMAVVGWARHLLYNKHLTSMSVPAQEESTRVGQIEIDLDVTATLVGYTGPCVAGDFEEGPWDDDSANSMGRRAQSVSELQRELFHSSGVPRVEVKEDFTIRGNLDHVLRRRELHVEPHWRGDNHLTSPRYDDVSFRLADREQGSLAEDSEVNIKDEGMVRRLRNKGHTACHSYVTMRAGGIALVRSKLRESFSGTTCERLSDRQCRVSFVCHACSLERETARIVLDVADGYVFTAAREIHWNVKATWLHPKYDRKTHAYSSVESIVTSGDLNGCLRGPDPSVVRMTVVPTNFEDLLRSSHLTGFVMQFIDAHMGSVANPYQFHEHLAQLQSIVELHTSHSFYKLVLSKKTTHFDFLTQVLGFLSGMSLIARVIYAVWLQTNPKSRASSEVLWTNPMVKCFSALFCFCVPEETEEEMATTSSSLLSVEENNVERATHPTESTFTGLRGTANSAGKDPLRRAAHQGEYCELPQSELPQSARSAAD